LALTGEEIVSAVAVNIVSYFTSIEILRVYKNKPLQNVAKPYAFIQQLNAVHTNELRGRAQRDYLLDIRVHPKDEATDIEVWARKVAEKMIDTLNIITVSNQKVKSRSLEWKTQDGVLHIIVGYAFKVKEVITSNPDMGTLIHREGVK